MEIELIQARQIGAFVDRGHAESVGIFGVYRYVTTRKREVVRYDVGRPIKRQERLATVTNAWVAKS